MESKRHLKPWFSEHALEELRKNRKDTTILDSDVLPARHVSYDMSYLPTREEREKLFNETIQAFEDVKNGKNVSKAFDNVEEMFEELDK